MSYNIDTWKTKKIENLVIPLEAFYIHERQDWHPEKIINTATNSVELRCGCEQTIRGTLHNDLLTITEFEMSGEGSGTFYDWILEPALKRSTGNLEAVLIWEGGDSITRLIVNNGEVSNEEIEL